ncbi:response regulator [Paracoccus xiamenensis]|uniref:response regulator n=1 Tax=Paracoccus xiamenensis TaxID=2714901 RepID=UPI001A99647F|nr:response regulator [Paracoccus xiamenensis]
MLLFTGHPWQMDMHMYFFAVLALNIAWFDRGQIFFGALLTATHHLVLLYLLPFAVFPGSGDLARVLLHAVIVVFQMLVLLWVVNMVQQTFARMAGLRDELVQKGAALEERTREAEAASRAKSMFLANISHEIRTPINAILGFSHLLQRAPLERRHKDQVGKINSAGVSLLRLINDVLDFSKIEAGKLEFDEREFDLRAAIGSQLQMVSESAHAKGLRVAVHIDSNIPPALIGDDMRFNQVILNLLSNAIKFTQEGRITLTAEMVELNDGIAGIRCTVQDTGIGLTEAQQGMLFNSFAQADASTTRRFGGTGLGLAICRQIVEQMAGWIGVESTPDTGSTFTFLVRMRVARTRAAAVPSTISTLGQLRILVTDDNPAARQIIQELFARMHMQADLASSGPKAIEMLQRAAEAGRPYDLLMIDWKMPDLNGFDTLRRLRRDCAGMPEPAIVMMTAHDLDECIHQGEGENVGAFLSKPVDAERLEMTLGELFATANSQASMDAGPDASAAQLPLDLQGNRVLLAEDNEINREIAVELLHAAGLVVDCAENGRIACEMLEADSTGYAAVLMDVQMPVMDGVSATRRIRQNWSKERLPIIAMTAHAYEEDRRRCLDAGMNDHVSKPIDPPVLIQALERWLGTATAGPAIPSFESGTAPDLPDDLRPFDISTALVRVNGKRDLLRRLILGFRDNYADICGRLSGQLEAGRTDEAMHLAHGLRGVAASLGLGDVSSIARQLEELARSGREAQIADLLLDLDDAVRAAIAAVDRLDGIAEEDRRLRAQIGMGCTTDPVATASARDALRDQICRRSLSARKGFVRYAEAIGMTSREQDADPLGAAIMRLEYDEALSLLDAAYPPPEEGLRGLSA